MLWTRNGLIGAGFQGFIPFDQLPSADAPRAEGVYVVVRPSQDPPHFLAVSPAGWFKGDDPTVDLEVLNANWVPDASVIYIGKATQPNPKRGLRRRLNEYRRHGAGAAVGHRGGRFIWQLEDSADLLVAWRVCRPATAVESQMLEQFIADYGALPFANRRR